MRAQGTNTNNDEKLPASVQENPPQQPVPAAAITETRVTIEVANIQLPCARIRNSAGLPGYLQKRVDLALESREALALRELFDGLAASGKFSRPNPSPADALRWLLRQVATARKL
jgi:hypothetical protein